MAGEDTSRIIDTEFLQAFHKGKEHFDNNRLEEAKVFLEKARKLKPNDEKVLNLLGMIYFKLNNLIEAEEIYSRLVQSNEGVYVLHSNLGLIQLKLGKLKEAEKSLLRALELQPNNPKAQVYVGLLYDKLGNYQKALEYFEKGGAHKLVEQMQEKIAASKVKEEVIEEAEIIEVIAKKTEEKMKEIKEKDFLMPSFKPEQKREEIEEEEKAEVFVEEGKIEETKPTPEVSKMAQELGIEIRKTPQVEEAPSEEIIIEEREEFKEEKKEEKIIISEEAAEKPTEEIISEEKIEKEEIKFPMPAAAEERIEKEEAFLEKPTEEIISEEKIEKEEIKTEEIISKEEKIEEKLEEKKIEEPIIFPEKEEKIPPPPEQIIFKPLSLDYFSRDKFYIQPLTGADRFLLIDPHLLEVILTEEVIIRKGAISSYSGNIKFEFLNLKDTEIPLIKCQGAGVLFLTYERREIFLFSLNNEEVNIEESHFLIAQSSLQIETRIIESKSALLNYMNIKGTGTIGITIKSAPLTLNVLASMPVNIYSDSLIAWSGKVNIKLLEEDEIKGIMTRFSESAFPLKFEGIGDVVVEQGILWGDRRAK